MVANVSKFQSSKTELNEYSKAGTAAGLISAQSLVYNAQKDVNKEGTTDHKERNSTARSAQKLNGAQHGVRPLIEIQILHFLLLFF
jgi:hypothetical protein